MAVEDCSVYLQSQRGGYSGFRDLDDPGAYLRAIDIETGKIVGKYSRSHRRNRTTPACFRRLAGSSSTARLAVRWPRWTRDRPHFVARLRWQCILEGFSHDLYGERPAAHRYCVR